MKPVKNLSVKGALQALVYAPNGEIEGALIASQDGVIQLVLDKQDELGGRVLQALEVGQILRANVGLASPAKRGAAHPVHPILDVVEVDGKKPAEGSADIASGYRGRVARLNFARHGEPNGVVLDTGDFIHLKPDGMRRLALAIGDEVVADGDAQRLCDDKGWAVEATHVNGRSVAA